MPAKQAKRESVDEKTKSDQTNAEKVALSDVTSSDVSPTDEELMQRVAKVRDSDAFAILVERYKGKLYATCYRMMGNVGEAEDMVQDSFIKLWTHAERWDGNKAKVTTWLYTITTNTCRDALRKRKAIMVEHDEGYGEHQEGDGEQPNDRIESEQTAGHVREALEALSEDQKQAVILSYYQELSHAEIGEIMGKTAKSIEGLVSRARKDMKGRLAKVKESLV